MHTQGRHSVSRLEDKMPSESSSLPSAPPSEAQSPSPSSFYTAKVAASPVTDGDTTNISSPAEAPDKLPYRDARQLPHELKEHCRIHLEERLCKATRYATSCFSFLTTAQQSVPLSSYSTACSRQAARGRTRPRPSLPSSRHPPRSLYSAHLQFILRIPHAQKNPANFKYPRMLFNTFAAYAPQSAP